MDVKIKQKKGNTFDVSLTGLTAGMILALKNALDNYPTPVASDVRDFLVAAIEKNADLKSRIS